MASGDFLDLQNNLAILAGRASASELDEDLALCKQVINEALLEVYRPLDRDGASVIPEWSRRTVTLQFRAPLEITLSVTLGSRIVTGYSFPTSTTGSPRRTASTPRWSATGTWSGPASSAPPSPPSGYRRGHRQDRRAWSW